VKLLIQKEGKDRVERYGRALEKRIRGREGNVWTRGGFEDVMSVA